MAERPETGDHRTQGLGELLRSAREERGMDLGDVAGVTHVRREYLEAIEQGRYGELPEDVYTRNFVRLFAQAVGVDVVRAQELYRTERRDAGAFNTVEQRLEHDREVAAEAPPAYDRPRWWEAPTGGPRLGPLLSTVLMVAAVVGLALWGFNSTFFTASRQGTTEEERNRSAREQEQAPGERDQEQEAAVLPRTVRLSVTSDPSGAEVSVDGFPLPGTTPIVSAPVTAREARTIRVDLEGYEPAEREFDLTYDRNLSFALAPATAEQGGTEQDAAAEEADGDAESPPDEAAADGDDQVTLRITEDTWLEVYQGNARNQGERLAFTTARPGQTFSFSLPVYIHAGNAGGVELTVAGQERGTLGSSGEVRGLAVTR